MESSPLIAKVEWGRLELADGTVFKDARLYPGGSSTWDWRETGTSHSPGIQPEDVTPFLELALDAVVLATGFEKALSIMPETVTALEQKGIAVHALTTQDAVNKYNELATDHRVAGLFHTTC